MTSINVFESLGIKPHLLYIEPRIALGMLRKGDIDAIIAVEGKPVQWLNQVNDPNLHLVPSTTTSRCATTICRRSSRRRTIPT